MTHATAIRAAGTAPWTRWKSCSPELRRIDTKRGHNGQTSTCNSGVDDARIARHVLLERTDDARRRGREEVLFRYFGLELRRHADGRRRRHLLARHDGR